MNAKSNFNVPSIDLQSMVNEALEGMVDGLISKIELELGAQNQSLQDEISLGEAALIGKLMPQD